MSDYNMEKIKQVQKSIEDNIELLLKNKKYLSPQEIQMYENMYSSYRCSGRTTRLVDKAIQELFSNMGAKMYFADHHDSIQADILLQERIIQRLEREHPNVSVTYSDGKYISIQERNKINLKYTTGNIIDSTSNYLKL